MNDFRNEYMFALYRRHRALGYSRRMSYRLALWCLEPEQ